MSEKTAQRCGLLGFGGGLLFMIGDFLLYVYPGRDPLVDIEPVVADIPLWRYTASAFSGLFGMFLMLFGFVSLYLMTRKVCGRFMQALIILSSFGVAGTVLAHFNVGCLLPLVYKASLANGVDGSCAENICLQISQWVGPLDNVIIVSIYLQFIVLSYMILSGRSGLRRWYIVIGPVGAVALGMIWMLVFKGSTLYGAWGACESFGEGLMYLTAFLFWRKRAAAL